MCKQAYRVDNKGYIIDTLVIETDSVTDVNIVTTDKPDGLYRAKWNGTEWVEDMTQEEIDELYNQPIVISELDKVKIAQAEQFEFILETLEGMM